MKKRNVRELRTLKASSSGRSYHYIYPRTFSLTRDVCLTPVDTCVVDRLMLDDTSRSSLRDTGDVDMLSVVADMT